MFSKASSALTALVFLQQLSSSSAQSSSTYSADLSTSTECPSKGGAHIIVARGSLESPPYGVQVGTKDNELAAIMGSTADGTTGYPNTLADYQNSETDGAIIARGLITDFASRCPGFPIVVTGYSQGANVLGDALIGQDANAFAPNASIDSPLPDSVLAQVAAFVFYGDPTFVTSESFLVGTAMRNGSFPRLNAALFESTGLAAKGQSYCNDNDLFCAGGNSLAVHVSYLPAYSNDTVAFVVKQVAAWYAANPAQAAGSAGTASGTASASKKPASASASASRYASASSVSACRSAASGTGLRSASASASLATASSTPSYVASTSTSPAVAISTGAASGFGVDMTMAAGAGAIVAGIFAALL